MKNCIQKSRYLLALALLLGSGMISVSLQAGYGALGEAAERAAAEEVADRIAKGKAITTAERDLALKNGVHVPAGHPIIEHPTVTVSQAAPHPEIPVEIPDAPPLEASGVSDIPEAPDFNAPAAVSPTEPATTSAAKRLESKVSKPTANVPTDAQGNTLLDQIKKGKELKKATPVDVGAVVDSKPSALQQSFNKAKEDLKNKITTAAPEEKTAEQLAEEAEFKDDTTLTSTTPAVTVAPSRPRVEPKAPEAPKPAENVPDTKNQDVKAQGGGRKVPDLSDTQQNDLSNALKQGLQRQRKGVAPEDLPKSVGKVDNSVPKNKFKVPTKAPLTPQQKTAQEAELVAKQKATDAAKKAQEAEAKATAERQAAEKATLAKEQVAQEAKIAEEKTAQAQKDLEAAQKRELEAQSNAAQERALAEEKAAQEKLDEAKAAQEAADRDAKIAEENAAKQAKVAQDAKAQETKAQAVEDKAIAEHEKQELDNAIKAEQDAKQVRSEAHDKLQAARKKLSRKGKGGQRQRAKVGTLEDNVRNAQKAWEQANRDVNDLTAVRKELQNPKPKVVVAPEVSVRPVTPVEPVSTVSAASAPETKNVVALESKQAGKDAETAAAQARKAKRIKYGVIGGVGTAVVVGTGAGLGVGLSD